jgi:hypothetical protein
VVGGGRRDSVMKTKKKPRANLRKPGRTVQVSRGWESSNQKGENKYISDGVHNIEIYRTDIPEQACRHLQTSEVVMKTSQSLITSAQVKTNLTGPVNGQPK